MKNKSIYTNAIAARLTAALDDAIPPAAETPQAPTQPAPDPVEEQAEGEARRTLSGYAVVWGVNSDEGSPRRFDKGNVSYPTDRPVLCLYNHDDSNVLGSTANDTLKIEPDEYGIKITCVLPGTACAADVYELVEDRYISGMSAGYFETSSQDVDGVHVPVIVIDEFTICATPAFLATTIDVVPDFESLDIPDDEPAFENLILPD